MFWIWPSKGNKAHEFYCIIWNWFSEFFSFLGPHFFDTKKFDIRKASFTSVNFRSCDENNYSRTEIKQDFSLFSQQSTEFETLAYQMHRTTLRQILSGWNGWRIFVEVQRKTFRTWQQLPNGYIWFSLCVLCKWNGALKGNFHQNYEQNQMLEAAHTDIVSGT